MEPEKNSESGKTIFSLNMSKEFTEYLAAASISLAVLCAGASYFFYTKWRTAENKAQAMEAQQRVLSEHSNAVNYNVQKELEDNLNVLSTIIDTNTIAIKLKGLPIALASKAVVYWKKDSQVVYLSLYYLPDPPKDKQYQLWAIKDGKPVDAGVFELNYPIQKMNNIEDAQSFVVTLEKKGGSTTPDLKAMYLKGTI
jgi:hypothetical protein